MEKESDTNDGVQIVETPQEVAGKVIDELLMIPENRDLREIAVRVNQLAVKYQVQELLRKPIKLHYGPALLMQVTQFREKIAALPVYRECNLNELTQEELANILVHNIRSRIRKAL